MTTKEKVLAYLEANRGKFASGEKIAESIGMSRNAVWKAIKQLEQEGLQIEAKTRKGYCLAAEDDTLTVQGICSYLKETKDWVRVTCFDSIGSTNQYAKELALEGAASGTVIVANQQTVGKGRYGKTFESPQGTGIYLSVILKQDRLHFSTPTLITMYTAVVIAETFEQLTGKKLDIKWVNDLFFKDKKVGGILTEAVTDFESGQIEWVVVGFGLNLTATTQDFSEEVAQVATSIFENEVMPLHRNELIANILEAFLTGLETVDETELLSAYRNRLLGLNQEVTITSRTDSYQATVLGIDSTGQLHVRLQDGSESFLNTGEVHLKL